MLELKFNFNSCLLLQLLCLLWWLHFFIYKTFYIRYYEVLSMLLVNIIIDIHNVLEQFCVLVKYT